ncbi:MAG TPA: response regulator [Burkholderiales bacterium]|nr:response regulator [Burkholderiales bacterium]
MSPILVADDDADESYLLVRAFEEVGVRNPVHVVPDGEAAIAFLKNNRPCLVLLDQQLPGCSGLDVLQWLRNGSSLSTVPVILLSASTYDSDVQAAYLVGANGYVVKPTQYEKTVALAKAIADYWLAFNRTPYPG